MATLVIDGYTTLVRGIPELVIMLLLFFGGEMLVNGFLGLLGLGPLRFNTFISGVLAIGFVFGAYYTETFRGAFLTVERGQLEAAMAYGMRPGQVFRRVLLPQMLSFAIPGINNNWLGLMKASRWSRSWAGGHGVAGGAGGRATQKPFLFYFLVALIYMVITAISSWGFSLLARRYALASSTAAGAR
ncbi:Histidine transport system permease protein hisQ [Serratia plymuthica]|uniref:Histidine transport system permease protein hisQ n=1 Tax=Serratia plymuthica TaxID=82996 RepID=A0A2X4UJ35_SERPL|nr:Histidine transport system permease protein hisQ [Serratia plymuthica]